MKIRVCVCAVMIRIRVSLFLLTMIWSFIGWWPLWWLLAAQCTVLIYFIQPCSLVEVETPECLWGVQLRAERYCVRSPMSIHCVTCSRHPWGRGLTGRLRSGMRLDWLSGWFRMKCLPNDSLILFLHWSESFRMGPHWQWCRKYSIERETKRKQIGHMAC